MSELSALMALLLSNNGIVFGLLFILMGSARGAWVWRWTYDEVCRERDFYRGIAMSDRSLSERSVAVAEQLTRGAS